jgi:hypothetical protein
MTTIMHSVNRVTSADAPRRSPSLKQINDSAGNQELRETARSGEDSINMSQRFVSSLPVARHLCYALCQAILEYVAWGYLTAEGLFG